MKVLKVGFELTGITEMLMHYDDVLASDMLCKARDAVKRNNKAEFSAGDDRCPADTWKTYLYNDGDRVCIPYGNLQSCIISAGSKLTYNKQTSFKKVLPGSVMFDEAFIEFRAANGKQLKLSEVNAVSGTFAEQVEAVKKLGFSLDVRRAAVGTSKHVRVRPKFAPGWKMLGTLSVVDDRVTLQNLKDIFTMAGLYVGIGDWRPDSPKKPGTFGRFAADVKAI